MIWAMHDALLRLKFAWKSVILFFEKVENKMIQKLLLNFEIFVCPAIYRVAANAWCFHFCPIFGQVFKNISILCRFNFVPILPFFHSDFVIRPDFVSQVFQNFATISCNFAKSLLQCCLNFCSFVQALTQSHFCPIT